MRSHHHYLVLEYFLNYPKRNWLLFPISIQPQASGNLWSFFDFLFWPFPGLIQSVVFVTGFFFIKHNVSEFIFVVAVSVLCFRLNISCINKTTFYSSIIGHLGFHIVILMNDPVNMHVYFLNGCVILLLLGMYYLGMELSGYIETMFNILRN